MIWIGSGFPVSERPGSGFIANVGAEMNDDGGNDSERTALEPTRLWRSGAAQLARDLAEIAKQGQYDQPSASTWRDIADAIERLWPKL